MVAGLEMITSGTVSIGGRVVNDVSPRHRDVAMVFQNYALYPHLTVYQNIGFALANKKVPRPELDRRVRSAAAVLGLSDLLGRKPRHLSGGQRQRVAMGRAIVRSPSVFLMDEPLSNLDAKLRVQMRGEVLQVHRSVGATTLYVGIRPEDLSVPSSSAGLESSAPSSGPSALVADARMVEVLGSEQHVYFSVDATPVGGGGEAFREGILAGSVPNGVARLDPRAPVRAGTRVTFAVDAARLRFFDPDTGNAVG